jgi:5-methylthioribose kinase
MIEQIWSYFEKEFRMLWENESKERMTVIPGYVDHYLHEVLADTSGYAGCKMMRRIIGLAHVSDLESIKDPNLRAKGEKLALLVGQKLVLERRQVQEINDITSRVRQISGWSKKQ